MVVNHQRPSDHRLATETTRTLHFYADSTTPADAVLQAAVTGWDQGRVTVAAQPDPAWHAVRHLRT